MYLKQVLLIFSLLSINNSWSMVTVGSSPGNGSCTFTTIQDALDSSDPEIRILNNQNFVTNLNIDHSVDIRGGFANCQDATTGSSIGANTIVKGTNLVGAAVISINTSSEFEINLYNLTLQDATDTIFITNGGHGINLLSSGGNLTLWNTIIKNNTSEKGGGVFMGEVSGEVVLTLRDSEISGNTASDLGGGVYCEGNGSNIRMFGDSVISGNTAANGGGLAIENGCTANLYSGLDAFDSIELKGIMENHASQNGGGLYLNNASNIQFGLLAPVAEYIELSTVSGNTADVDGAGIYAINGTGLLINDAFLNNNVAGRNGGGIYLGLSSFMVMRTIQEQCRQAGKCSVLSNNKSGITGLGGGFYMNGNANATIWNTFIYGNRADFGTAIYVSGSNEVGASLQMDGNYLYNNGDNGSGNYQDSYVIRGNGDVEINILHNTITDNNVNDTRAIIGVANGVTMSLKNSIIHNINETVLDDVSSNILDNRCLLVNEDTSISGPIVLALTSPDFVNANARDYHLTSTGIDWCNPHGGFVKDTDNELRGWDDPTDNGILAFYDVGADESYNGDIVFTNGFE